jgi:cardiolipin synthase
MGPAGSRRYPKLDQATTHMKLRRLADRITLLRIVLIPFLWALAFIEARTALAVGFAIAGATDVLDGYIARTQRTSAWGAQLDSIADTLLLISGVLWLVLLRPDFVRAEALLLGVWVTLAVIMVVIGWVKFRRIANLHLYSSKAAGFLATLFLIYLLIVDDYSRPVFYVVVGFLMLSVIETIAVMLLRNAVDEHARSIFLKQLPVRPPRSRSPVTSKSGTA